MIEIIVKILFLLQALEDEDDYEKAFFSSFWYADAFSPSSFLVFVT